LHNEIRKNPDLAVGGVTWSWLNAAYESIEKLKQKKGVQNITTPILMLSAQKDAIVCPKAQKRLSRQLPNCIFHPIKGAFHELLFESKHINDQVWDAIDDFIQIR
jgi:lysophospholipase